MKSNKKLILGIIIGVISAALCTSIVLGILYAYVKKNTPQMSTDENGNSVMSTNGRETVFADDVPAEINYNGKKIILKNIDISQKLIGYSYYLFVYADYDISSLTDTERHWLFEEDLSVSAYVTDEDNNLDFASLKVTEIQNIDNKTMRAAFSSLNRDDIRHEFNGCKISVVMDLKLEATHEYTDKDGKNTNLNNTASLHFSKTYDAITISE